MSYQNNELYHYGVVGMKWGVRKAVNKDKNVRSLKKQQHKDYNDMLRAGRRTKMFAVTKRGKQKKAQRDREFDAAYKKYEKSVRQWDSARKEATNKAAKNIKGAYSAKAKRNIANMSTGKAAAQSLLMGSYGAAVYNNAKSKGMTRGKAAATAVMANWGNNLTLGGLSRAAVNSTKKKRR